MFVFVSDIIVSYINHIIPGRKIPGYSDDSLRTPPAKRMRRSPRTPASSARRCFPSSSASGTTPNTDCKHEVVSRDSDAAIHQHRKRLRRVNPDTDSDDADNCQLLVAPVDDGEERSPENTINLRPNTPTEAKEEDAMLTDKVADINSVHRMYNMRLCTIGVKRGQEAEILHPDGRSWCVTLVVKDKDNSHIDLEFMHDDPAAALFTSTEMRPGFWVNYENLEARDVADDGRSSAHPHFCLRYTDGLSAMDYGPEYDHTEDN